MPSRSPIAALLALSGLAACADPPSYALRWSIEGKDGVSAATCAESGLLQVRARVFSGPDSFVDERIYPCSPETFEGDEGQVPGSPLAIGRYAIELRGIDRASQPWDDPVLLTDPDQADHPGCRPEASGSECRPNERVCDCVFLDVDAAGLGTLVDEVGDSEAGNPPTLVYALDPPPECEDGIDNDRDGRTDDRDPSCAVSFGDGTEGTPVGITDFDLAISALGGNPNIACGSVERFDGITLQLVGLRSEANPEGTLDEPIPLFDGPCLLDRPYRFAVPLPLGTATFAVVGIGRDGEPVTEPVLFEQELIEGGNLVKRTVDFGYQDFLEPIEGFLAFEFDYRGSLGTNVGARASCVSGGSSTPGQLDITDIRVTINNAHGSMPDEPVSLSDGTVLDGTTLLPCLGEPQFTAALDWASGFLLSAEALSSEGEVCFSIEDYVMAPSTTAFIDLVRVYDDDGQVPESCRDCEQALDCEPAVANAWQCIDNVCQDTCDSDLDCRPEGLDDSFSCVLEADEDGEPLDLGYCRRAG